jgi:hypothetical protein
VQVCYEFRPLLTGGVGHLSGSMKQETKKQLDKIQRQERLKNLIPALYISLALIVIFAAILLYRYSPGKSTEVYGVVTGLLGKPVPKRGEIIYLLVELDGGEVIKVKKPDEILYKKGKRVQLTEIKSFIFGNTRYDFQAYTKEQ